MKLRRRVAVTVVTGIAASLAAAPAQAGGPATRVEWGVCPEEVEVVSPTLQCATVPVPLDYRDPDGVKIDIAVSRIASAKPAERRGILLLNPGGPGASGLTMPADLVGLGLPSSVSERYDLIGIDPRGVGRSAPVSCGFTGELDYFSNVPPYAVDDTAVIERARTAKAAAEWCAANDTEGRLRHITTANTVRDLDAIRAALGEEKASYFGASYGSALGAAYASMFPDTTDRVVIDSNLGDTHLDYAAMRRFGLGVEQTFPDFAAWAAARAWTISSPPIPTPKTALPRSGNWPARWGSRAEHRRSRRRKAHGAARKAGIRDLGGKARTCHRGRSSPRMGALFRLMAEWRRKCLAHGCSAQARTV
jgi:pimeloyl-ACP methyl ester carboxylesterase